MASVIVGSSARLTIEGVTEPLTAKVAFLSPTIDERTRTRKARFELANVSAAVMPGAFVTVELEVARQRGLAVPESAVIRPGARSIVFIVHGTHAEPREVKLAGRVGDYCRVESGVVAGERVATGAQFLLDDGVGSDLAKRIAAPMWGGLVSLTILTLFAVPAVYVVWRSFQLRRSRKQTLGSLADAERGG